MLVQNVGSVVNVSGWTSDDEFRVYPEGARDRGIMLGASHIGYINRGQLKAFHGWLAHNNVSACVERINGREDRPLIYLYVQISSNDMGQGMRVAGAGG